MQGNVLIDLISVIILLNMLVYFYLNGQVAHVMA